MRSPRICAASLFVGDSHRVAPGVGMCFDAPCDFIRVSHFRITNNLELAAIVRGQEWLETEGARVAAKVGRDIADSERALRFTNIVMRLDEPIQGFRVLLTPAEVLLEDRRCVKARMVVKGLKQLALIGGRTGLAGDGLPIMRDRLVQTALKRHCEAEMVMRFAEIGPLPDGLAVSDDCLFQIPLLFQGETEIHLGLDHFGLEPDDFPVSVDRRLKLSLIFQNAGEVVMSIGIVRLDRQRSAVSGDGLICAACPPECDSQVALILGDFRLDRDGPGDQVDGFCGAALVVHDQAQQLQRIRIVGGLVQDLGVDPPGLFEAAAAVVLESNLERPLDRYHSRRHRPLGSPGSS